jgi:hypothetical protein
MILNTNPTNITIEMSLREMMDKLKGKIWGKKDGRVDAAASPFESPPGYINDNPMFPAKSSVPSSNDTIDFVLGMDFPKVEKSQRQVESQE